MSRSPDNRERPWRITMAAVGGLLVAIIIIGVMGLFLNQSIKRVADDAFNYDVEIEDEGDDLKAVILDARDYHRTLYFGGPTRGAINDFEGNRHLVEEEIDELERIGPYDEDIPQPEEIRAMADEYYEDFGRAIDDYERTKDRHAWEDTSDLGLARLAKMEQAAAEIDALGEKLSSESLQRVDRRASTATLVLLIAIGGLLVAGMGLAYAAVRVVNELRRLYAEQQKASDKLAEASKAKTDFLADVSHELRTPLTVLRGNAEIGIRLEKDEDQKEILHEILGESDKMTKMVEDLLFLARSDSSLPPLDLAPVRAASFLSGISDRASVLVRERGARLETDLSVEGELKIDPGRIEQAVLILVDNAAKYGSQGGGEVSLSAKTDSGELCIEVVDKGPGIPEEDLSRVFERFYRVDKARSRRLGGSGLGLPIAKTIVEAHGGRIEARSRVGEGTKMSIHLPLFSGPEIQAHRRTSTSTSR